MCDNCYLIQQLSKFHDTVMKACRQQRYDPTAVIMDIPDAEVHRGLYELVTRGLLPKSLDATPAFEGDVLALTGILPCFSTHVMPVLIAQNPSF